jgi:hypothetical protein
MMKKRVLHVPAESPSTRRRQARRMRQFIAYRRALHIDIDTIQNQVNSFYKYL